MRHTFPSDSLEQRDMTSVPAGASTEDPQVLLVAFSNGFKLSSRSDAFFFPSGERLTDLIVTPLSRSAASLALYASVCKEKKKNCHKKVFLRKEGLLLTINWSG